jgi:hypothetical protein
MTVVKQKVNIVEEKYYLHRFRRPLLNIFEKKNRSGTIERVKAALQQAGVYPELSHRQLPKSLFQRNLSK